MPTLLKLSRSPQPEEGMLLKEQKPTNFQLVTLNLCSMKFVNNGIGVTNQIL
jgi:hypothetical protein